MFEKAKLECYKSLALGGEKWSNGIPGYCTAVSTLGQSCEKCKNCRNFYSLYIMIDMSRNMKVVAESMPFMGTMLDRGIMKEYKKCSTCLLPFTRRAKYKNDETWIAVKYCSEKCKKGKNKVLY